MQRVIPDNILQAVRTRPLEEIKATRKRINPVLHPLFNLTMQNKIDMQIGFYALWTGIQT
jgi:hypothetical protein